jgi:tetratricopeptide (TPR) repeat protein
MKEFIDIEHSVQEEFNLLMDLDLKDITWIIKKLQELIKEDPNYFDPYVYLHKLYLELENFFESEKILLEGYNRALQLILNVNDLWPSRLRWTIIENRHIIRLLETVGIWYWRNNDYDKALNLFRKLLKSDPNDNIGVRYYILALKMNVDYINFNECLDKGGFYDCEIEEWFSQDHKKFPDEFEWWIKEIKKLS